MNQLEEWLFLAEADYNAALWMMKSENAPYHIVTYHLHQAVEKMMKAYLFCCNKEIPFSHDLRKLGAIIMKTNPELLIFRDNIIELDEYFPKIRYPYGDLIREEMAITCVRLATEVYRSIFSKVEQMLKH